MGGEVASIVRLPLGQQARPVSRTEDGRQVISIKPARLGGQWSLKPGGARFRNSAPPSLTSYTQQLVIAQPLYCCKHSPFTRSAAPN